MNTVHPEPSLPVVPQLHLVVTRHRGAAEWVCALLELPVQTVSHLDPSDIQAGCCYYGVFPLHLAAAICSAGAQCWAITMDLPPELRGQELSAEQLSMLGAQLVRYEVSTIDQR